jgi:hypothetical protein
LGITTDSRRVVRRIDGVSSAAAEGMFMGFLVQLLDRSKEFVCDRCGAAFLSGVCRFEAGHRVGSLCHACAESRLSFPLATAFKMFSSSAARGGLRRKRLHFGRSRGPLVLIRRGESRASSSVRRNTWFALVAGLISALTLAGMLTLSWHAWAVLQPTVS